METVVSTKIITITSCSNNNNNNHVCHPTTVLATSTMTKTIDNTITEYITYCPLTQQPEQLSTINPYTGASYQCHRNNYIVLGRNLSNIYYNYRCAAAAVIITQTEITTVETRHMIQLLIMLLIQLHHKLVIKYILQRLIMRVVIRMSWSSSLPAITTTVEGRVLVTK